MQRTIAVSLTVLVAALIAVSMVEADQGQSREMEQTQEQIYGSQLMTAQEGTEYRAKLQAATSAEEREQIRKEHHDRMQARAKARGLTLPPEPPTGGGGMGMGAGGGRNR